MQTYREFRPTRYDTKGMHLRDWPYEEEEYHDWYVAPVDKNRDSDTLTKCNYQVFEELVKDEEGDTFTCSFGHWAWGWFEIILIRPESKAYSIAVDTENRLDECAILDEDLYTEMEWTEFTAWVIPTLSSIADDHDIEVGVEDISLTDMLDALGWDTGETSITPSEEAIADYLRGLLCHSDDGGEECEEEENEGI